MTDSLPALSETIIRDAADAIVYADADGAIRFWNAAAERIFGYATTEAIGQSLDIIIPEKLRGRHWEGYRRVMQTGQSRYGAGDLLAVPAQRKDGTRISVEFTIVLLLSQTQAVTGTVAVMRDVTKRFEELRELKRRLAQAGASS